MATSRVATQKTPLAAYVLHRHDWSESSLIVELFTRERGRLVVVAKGAKRPTSQLRPVLLPFQPLHALLGRAPADDQGEVHLLRSAEWAGGAPMLGGTVLFSGFYLNELLLKLLARQDPHPALYDTYADTLAALPGDEAAALRAFELTLLRALGWLPELNVVTQTAQALQPDKHYTLDAESGVSPQREGASGNDWVALEAALRHGHPAALRAACAPVAALLRSPLRSVLQYHLGPTTLRTRQVMLDVQRLADVPP
jgi:DNA repair protein RecO (recombination protein O)